MKALLETLKTLSGLRGIAGDEGEVREYICKRVEGMGLKFEVDPLGNVIVDKKGSEAGNGKKLMICAHMDEVGFIVQHIADDGSLSFAPVGGVQPEVAGGRAVRVGKKGVAGVIGMNPIHLLSAEERKKLPKISELAINIGAKDKADAENYVAMGDSVTFAPSYDFGPLGDLVVGRAIDDRGGCAMMLELMEESLPYDVTFVFTVQEEIGTRGAKTASFSVKPDIAIVLENTTAADLPSAEGEKKVCIVGGGPVVSFMDRSTIYDKELYRLGFDTAKAAGMPVQTKTMVAGGNDSGAIHVSRGGVRTMAISAPCRYLHSGSCVVSPQDLEHCMNLTKLMIGKILG